MTNMSFKLFIGYHARMSGYNIGSAGRQGKVQGRKTQSQEGTQKTQKTGGNGPDTRRYFETNSPGAGVGGQHTVLISSGESGDEHTGPFLEPLSGMGSFVTTI